MIINIKTRLKKWKMYLIISLLYLSVAIANCVLNLSRDDNKIWLNTVSANMKIYLPFLLLFILPVISFSEARNYIFKNYRTKYYEDFESGWKRFCATLSDYLFSIIFMLVIVIIYGTINFLIQLSFTRNYLNNLIYLSISILVALIGILIYFPILCIVAYTLRRRKITSLLPIVLIPILFIVNTVVTSISLSNYVLNKDQFYFHVDEKKYDYKELKYILSAKSSKIYKQNFLQANNEVDALNILDRILKDYYSNFIVLKNKADNFLFVNKLSKEGISRLTTNKTLDKLIRNMLFEKTSYIYLDELISYLKTYEVYQYYLKSFEKYSKIDFEKIPTNILDYWIISNNGFDSSVPIINGENIVAVSTQLVKEMFIYMLYASAQDEKLLNLFQDYLLLFFQNDEKRDENLSYFDEVFNGIESDELKKFKTEYNYKTINDFVHVYFTNIIKNIKLSSQVLTDAEFFQIKAYESRKQMYHQWNVLDYFNKLYYVFDWNNLDISSENYKKQNPETYYLFDAITEINFKTSKNQTKFGGLKNLRPQLAIIVSIVFIVLIVLANPILIVIKNKFVAILQMPIHLKIC
ncbi:hypothetical protein SCLARK_00810 [Spiroplasma clarkii]|nr:hypothetical protein [Spiroplasma clarkii]ARU91439.1 hypothetical protein SCLARK_00810 [Spiroplasma clarkii]